MDLAANTRRESGFSLVELMVSMVLGLMLIAGAVSIYLATSQSYREVEQVAALSENARFANQILGDSLRHAGFVGEVPANRVDNDSNLTAVTGDCTTAGSEAYNLNRLGFAATVDSSGNALGCVTDGYIPPAGAANDVLVLKHAVPIGYADGPRNAFDPNDATHSDGVIDALTSAFGGDEKTWVMTNNVSGLLFDGADTPPTITIGGDIPGGTAWEYQYEVFYIRDAAGDTRSPQLSRKYLGWDSTLGGMAILTEDIVEGVERLHLLFGYDSNNDGEVDRYSDLASIGSNWDGIQSVEIFMLVRSALPDPQYIDDRSYTLGNLAIAAQNDNFRRMVSHASISLRNLKLMQRGGI